MGEGDPALMDRRLPPVARRFCLLCSSSALPVWLRLGLMLGLALGLMLGFALGLVLGLMLGLMLGLAGGDAPALEILLWL